MYGSRKKTARGQPPWAKCRSDMPVLSSFLREVPIASSRSFPSRRSREVSWFLFAAGGGGSLGVFVVFIVPIHRAAGMVFCVDFSD